MDSDATTLAVGVVNAPMQNFTFRAHSEYFGDPITATRGVINGPGTHSGDADRSLIVADGYPREFNSPVQ